MTSDENPADTVIEQAAAVLNGAIVREALAGNLEIEVFTGDGISLERALAHSLAEAGLLADPADRDWQMCDRDACEYTAMFKARAERAKRYLTASPRFWSKVDIGSCWLWTGSTDEHGYGQFWFEGRLVSAHRWSYESLRGPIPDGLFLDHLCRVVNCVNPVHLEPVTNRENVIRGFSSRGPLRYCRKGHEMTEENTYTRPDGSNSTCRTCKRARDAQRRAKKQVEGGSNA